MDLFFSLSIHSLNTGMSRISFLTRHAVSVPSLWRNSIAKERSYRRNQENQPFKASDFQFRSRFFLQFTVHSANGSSTMMKSDKIFTIVDIS